jgi:hypothetical protein
MVTQAEFAAIMVQQTVLPNTLTYSPQEILKWQTAGLEIRPLALILEILEELTGCSSSMCIPCAINSRSRASI